MRTLFWAVVMASVLAVTPAHAADGGHSGGEPKGDAKAGKQLVTKGKPDNPMVMPCQSCHGTDGKGNPQAKFPRLAGQNMQYMVKQLKDFASGDRTNYPTMTNIAKGMSEQEMWDAARYYNQQKVDVEGADAEKAMIKLGEQIAERGVPEQNVPACTSCHGPKGLGVPPVFPQIAGQHASYIEKQLQDWEAGNRQNDPAKMMTDIAPKLSEKQMKAVGAYFSHVDAQQGGSAKH
ncbi:c-type cytochrome [Thiohalorhabdus sp. Cl-TMA]|uniref:Cytochrome c n=1 Tax=Thiohalorhabdus methylotrophus TaxID=3242694 RepID=A0ABV4TU60_9GAMM